MKHQSASILFLNSNNEVLLLLRDDIPTIPYPNMWDIPGGGMEGQETPKECIMREMREEMGLDVSAARLFSVEEFPDRTDHIFWMKMDCAVEDIVLTEGQCIKWFSEQDAKNTDIAFASSPIIHSFFDFIDR